MIYGQRKTNGPDLDRVQPTSEFFLIRALI